MVPARSPLSGLHPSPPASRPPGPREHATLPTLPVIQALAVSWPFLTSCPFRVSLITSPRPVRHYPLLLDMAPPTGAPVGLEPTRSGRCPAHTMPSADFRAAHTSLAGPLSPGHAAAKWSLDRPTAAPQELVMPFSHVTRTQRRPSPVRIRLLSSSSGRSVMSAWSSSSLENARSSRASTFPSTAVKRRLAMSRPLPFGLGISRVGERPGHAG